MFTVPLWSLVLRGLTPFFDEAQLVTARSRRDALSLLQFLFLLNLLEQSHSNFDFRLLLPSKFLLDVLFTLLFEIQILFQHGLRYLYICVI